MNVDKIERMFKGRFIFVKQIIFSFFCLFHKYDNRLLQFKDKHKGERCFIVGAGPSLTLEDVNLLKDEVTFSMNSCVKLFDQTDWRPTYYVISDGNVFKTLQEEINTADLRTAFYADTPSFFKYKRVEGFRKDGIPFKENCINDIKLNAVKRKEFDFKYSLNPRYGFYSGWTVVYEIIQFAAYMGFREVYLLGIDCDYTSEQMHSKCLDYKYKNKPSLMRGNNMLYALGEAKKIEEACSMEIYNATRGGKLECFRRVDLEQVINS